MLRLQGIAYKTAKKAPILTVDRAVITIPDGIIGDWRGGGGIFRGRQVTVLSSAQWHAACIELGEILAWTDRRANLLIEGHDFIAADVGRTIVFVGGVELEITGETKPCKRMEAVRPGLKAALTPFWRAGVTCRVVKGGTLDKYETFVIRY